MVPLLTTERSIIGVAGFALLLLLERLQPFRLEPPRPWSRLRINLFIAGSNILLLSLLLGGALLAAYQSFELRRFGLLHGLGIGSWANVAITVLALDGLTYWWHRAYHQLPLLWRMHRAHHSDLAFDVTTAQRFHVLEMLLSAVFRLGVIALLGPVVGAIVIFEIVFGLFNQFEHANLQLPARLDRWLRLAVVTPAMHRVHHSERLEDTNSNYGTIFSFWDRLFGSYRVIEDQRQLRIGLPEYASTADVTLGKVLAMPFAAPCGVGHRAGLRLAGIAALLIALAPLGAAWAQEPTKALEAASMISAVTVFPDRAMVTRQAKVKLPSGAHTIRFAGLPASLEDDSVSAKGQGESAVTLFGARVVRTQLPEAQSPRLRELQQQIEEVSDQIRAQQNVKEVLQQKREFLASIQAASVQQLGKDIVTKLPPVADVAGLVGFIEQGLAASWQQDQEADAKLRELSKELDRLNRELAQLQGQAWRAQADILVDVQAKDAGSFTLEVSYRVPGATWQPAYEVRAQADGAEVGLSLLGVIRQQTGEDWGDVALTLSTAKPALGGRMPEIEPWWLRKQEIIAYDKMAQERMGRGAMMAQTELTSRFNEFRADAPAALPAQQAQAIVAAQGPAVNFTLAKPETIASDWQPTKAPIATHTLRATLAYETTPRLAPYAYLHAKTTNSTELIFLAGQASVFLDGAFTGTSWLKQVAPGEEFDVYLGVDERIRVERKTLTEKIDVSVLPGLHGRLKTIDAAYVTTIENFRSRPADITVIDQIPVSQHDEIKVEQVAQEPKASEQDADKPGVFRWKLQIPAQGKQTVKLSYRIKHPVDFIVEGW